MGGRGDREGGGEGVREVGRREGGWEVGREGLNRRYNCGSCSPWAALTHPRPTLLLGWLHRDAHLR